MKFIIFSISILFTSVTLLAQSGIDQKFVCPPCGCNLDDKKFDEVGKCPSCGMNMVGEVDPSAGYPYRNIYPGEVCGLSKDDWIILDVRTKREFNGDLGHLKGAIHIHVEDLEDRIEELSEFKERNVLVYCRISIRSMRASKLLVEEGFTNVTNMLGGMELWNDMNLDGLVCKESARVIE